MTTINHILKHKLVPVFYHDDKKWCIDIINVCYKSGIRVFEFTNRGAQALNNFQSLVKYKEQNCPEMILGAGTILSQKNAANFIKAGASFIVSPCFIDDVMTLCTEKLVTYLPGCMTVKEIFDANMAGCNMVKIFPSETVGPGFIKAVKAVLPDVKLMGTGGVNNENLSTWLNAGTEAIGLGSNYFEKPGPDALITIAKKLDTAVKNCNR